MNIKELYQNSKQKLEKAGIDSPAFDVTCLIQHVFQVDRQQLITDGSTIPAEPEKLVEYNACIRRRMKGEPLQYILGKWHFMDLELYVGEGVLIPRDDTEVVVTCCTNHLQATAAPKVLDLCAGSGAICLSVKKQFPHASVTAVEKSSRAVSYLNQNIQASNLEIEVIHDDIFTCARTFADNSFDLIVSNPPYIRSQEISALQTEVQFEPALALDGGADGYDFYRFIVSQWACKLKRQGMLAFELGENQFDYVSRLMEQAGFTAIQDYFDLQGIQRAITGTYLEK